MDQVVADSGLSLVEGMCVADYCSSMSDIAVLEPSGGAGVTCIGGGYVLRGSTVHESCMMALISLGQPWQSRIHQHEAMFGCLSRRNR